MKQLFVMKSVMIEACFSFVRRLCADDVEMLADALFNL